MLQRCEPANLYNQSMNRFGTALIMKRNHIDFAQPEFEIMFSTLGRDPLFRLILIFLVVFIVGMLATNEQARSVLLNPLSA